VKTNDEDLMKKLREQKEYISKFKDWKLMYKKKLTEAYD